MTIKANRYALPATGRHFQMDLANVLELDNPDIFYINHESFASTYWVRNTGLVNENFLTSLKNYHLVIIDISSEHWGLPEHNLSLSVRENLIAAGIKKFIIITHLVEDHQRFPEIIFCPSEYHVSRKFIQPGQTDFSKQKSHLLSCLNSKPRPHRIYYYTKIFKEPWVSDMLYSFSLPTHNYVRRPDEIILDQETMAIWEENKPVHPFLGKGKLWDLTNPAYSDSYANLVTENSVFPGVYLSEKMWKPIASGMWFFVLGCPGTIDHLRTLGVDVFDDLFDHDYYDQEIDFFQRVEKLNIIIKDYLKRDHNLLWHETFDRRNANYQRFYSGSFDDHYLQNIKKIIKETCD